MFNICRVLIVADKVNFEATKPIRTWLKQNGELFSEANDLKVLAEQLEHDHSKPKIDQLVQGCHEFLKNRLNNKLSERKGFESVRKALFLIYLSIGCLVFILFYLLPLNFFVWITTEKWLFPIPFLGEEMPRFVEFSTIYFIVSFSGSIGVSLCLAFFEYKTFNRILVKVQLQKSEKVVSRKNVASALFEFIWSIYWFHPELDKDKIIDETKGKGKKVGKRKYTCKNYLAKVDTNESLSIPDSVGERFNNNELVICSVTKDFFGRKRLWEPFEPI